MVRSSKLVALKKNIINSELADNLQSNFLGKSYPITNIAQLPDAKRGSLCFSVNAVNDCIIGATYIVSDLDEKRHMEGAFIIGVSPRLLFIEAINFLNFFGFITPHILKPCISDSAKIHERAIIETGCQIGQNTKIHAGAVIKSGSRIGDHCVIGENVVIGSDGFGFERNRAGVPVQFPHLCGVEIGHDVMIAPNTVVSKGALNSTKIGNHARINSNVLIGHHSDIGESTYIHAGCVISGGAKIGNHSWVGTNATVLQKKSVGNNCVVGSGGVVTNDVRDGLVVAGVPAKPIRDAD